MCLIKSKEYYCSIARAVYRLEAYINPHYTDKAFHSSNDVLPYYSCIIENSSLLDEKLFADIIYDLGKREVSSSGFLLAYSAALITIKHINAKNDFVFNVCVELVKKNASYLTKFLNSISMLSVSQRQYFYDVILTNIFCKVIQDGSKELSIESIKELKIIYESLWDTNDADEEYEEDPLLFLTEKSVNSGLSFDGKNVLTKVIDKFSSLEESEAAEKEEAEITPEKYEDRSKTVIFSEPPQTIEENITTVAPRSRSGSGASTVSSTGAGAGAGSGAGAGAGSGSGAGSEEAKSKFGIK